MPTYNLYNFVSTDIVFKLYEPKTGHGKESIPVLTPKLSFISKNNKTIIGIYNTYYYLL